MDFSSGIFAFFINDFQFSDSKIGAFKFYYDSISEDFIVKDNPELRYSKEIVTADPHFLIFKEIPVENKEESDLDFEVKPYKMWSTLWKIKRNKERERDFFLFFFVFLEFLGERA